MAKIAISLPEGVYEALEKSRAKRGVSRSEYIRDAVEERLRREKQQADIERYIQGYLRDPETPEEMAWVEQVGVEALASLPWEDGDEA